MGNSFVSRGGTGVKGGEWLSGEAWFIFPRSVSPAEEGQGSNCWLAGLHSTTAGSGRVIKVLQRLPSFSLESEKEVQKTQSDFW